MGDRALRQPAVLGWLRLARVYQQVQRAAGEHVRRYGLSLAQFDVLAHVGAAEGLTQQALADHLLVTQLLDRMERAGLIERRPEGRAKRLWLTAAGRALYREVVPAHEAFIAGQFAMLAPAEQRRLLRLLHRVDHGLAASGGKACPPGAADSDGS
jgi:DNA-binding MarR family transcriptional regulator